MTDEARLEELEKTVKELKEIEAIRKLQARYCKHVDEANLEGIKELFARECALTIRPWGEWKTRQEVIGFYENYFNEYLGPRHYITNQDIQVAGDEAHAFSYLLATVEHQGESLFAAGHYQDHLVKEDGVWRFKEKLITVLFMNPIAQGWSREQSQGQ
ncbi:MAG: nuclear transport factor 2 family protein [Candidatus Tectomicrobia bacterium]|uniref:Nuclear transport factor 2 family protein n=1 Tax=Tectimicrobiota bacterium TaxID=2528274 RepID=A0A932CMA6_UNCTE|nr:nuclear transport factor 2 family protein [Candidatus Tectomicrobia bacterium]